MRSINSYLALSLSRAASSAPSGGSEKTRHSSRWCFRCDERRARCTSTCLKLYSDKSLQYERERERERDDCGHHRAFCDDRGRSRRFHLQYCMVVRFSASDPGVSDFLDPGRLRLALRKFRAHPPQSFFTVLHRLSRRAPIPCRTRSSLGQFRSESVGCLPIALVTSNQIWLEEGLSLERPGHFDADDVSCGS